MIEKSDSRRPFNISAQPLQAALEKFMTVTSHSGLYDSALTAGLYSTEVKGVLTPEVALHQLVGGTGLTVRYASGDTFSIVQGPREGRAVIPPSIDAMTSYESGPRAQYFGAIQASLKEVFCGSSLTTPGTYRVALSLWVLPSGVIEKVHLLDTTGARDRDARILAGVRGLQLPPLPSAGGIRQPITMVVLPKPLSEGGRCAD